MRRKLRRTNVRAFLALLAISPFLIWSLSSSAGNLPGRARAREAGGDVRANPLGSKALAAGMLFAPPKADLDQVRNGTAVVPINPADWVNGNAGASNSHYIEGQSIPYRMRLTNIALSTHTVDIEWDIKHSDKNAIDYITTVVRTPPQNLIELIDPCRDVAGCVNAPSPNPNGSGGFKTFTIPAPISSKAVNGNPQPQTSFAALPAADKLFRIYNGTIQNITYINNADGNFGDLNVAQSSTRIRVEFTAANSTVVLAWGGHIGSRNDWGFTAGVPNSAGGISGSPYHTRLIAFDGSGGNQDRSLSAGAVSAPAECGIACNDPQDDCGNVCVGSVHTYKSAATQDLANTYSWSFAKNPDGTPKNTSGASFVGMTNQPTVQVNAGNTAGGYTLHLEVVSAGGTTSCDLPVTVKAATDVTTGPSPVAACDDSHGPANFSVSAVGANLHYAWKVNGVAAGTDSSSLAYDPFALAPGSYTVRVDVTGDCGADFAETTLMIKPLTDITTPPEAASACDDSHGLVNFSVAASGSGTLHYVWKVDGGVVGTDSSSLAYDPFALAPGSYTVRVDVTGDCGADFAETTLTVNGKPSATIAITQECDAFAKLTATPSGGSGSGYGFSWSGPAGGIAADDGTCGPTRACILVSKTGTYTATVTDSKSCSGSQNGQLCFSLTSQGPNQASVDVQLGPPHSASPAERRSVAVALIVQIVNVFSWMI
jgi:hypothetical protein